MNYWLVKQEPEAYSWTTFAKERRTAWTGVRSFPARANLRKMTRGDVVLYYHSVSEKQIVGIARVEKEAYSDPTADEGEWVSVDLRALGALSEPVSLDTIRADKVLKTMPLVRQSRLSVMPI